MHGWESHSSRIRLWPVFATLHGRRPQIAPQVEARGGTPKWAQGWLAARRWEDYVPDESPPTARTGQTPIPDELTPEEWEKATEARRRLEASRRQKEEKALAGRGIEICAQ